jgi:pimeloyl-ACP methyl ester carboxylesterase
VGDANPPAENQEHAPMPNVSANGLTIEYETSGDPDRPAILLMMGLGAQLVYWPDEFCQALAARGFYVIRYDNRDVGLSTKTGGPTSWPPSRVTPHRPRTRWSTWPLTGLASSTPWGSAPPTWSASPWVA